MRLTHRNFRTKKNYICDQCKEKFRLKMSLINHKVNCNFFIVTTKNNSSRQRRGKYIRANVYIPLTL